MIDEKRLAEIREREAKATKGPWLWDGDVTSYDEENDAPWLVSEGEKQILTGGIKATSKADVDFIAHARTDIPFLLAQLEAARREVEKLEKRLAAVADLINESSGVFGLHLNGDNAYWSELRIGGRFEEWLCDFDIALNKPAPQPQEG